MSLTKNPLAPTTDLECLGIESEDIPDKIGSEVVQRANIATYLSGMYCLGFGRRDLLPLCLLWHKATALAHMKEPNDLEAASITEQWCVCFMSTLRDWLISMPEAAVVPYDYGSDRNINVADLLSKAISRIENGEVPEKSDLLLTALSLEPKEMKVMNFVGRCCGVASVVALNAQHHAISIREGQPHTDALERAEKTMQKALGGDFLHTIAYTAQAVLDLEGKCMMEEVWSSMVEATCDIKNSLSTLQEPPPNDDRYVRRERRWSSGIISDEIADDQGRVMVEDLLESMDSALELCRLHELPMPIGKLRSALVAVAEYAEQEYKSFVPMTFMQPEAYDLFIRDGHTVTVWDLADRPHFEDTWHHRYSDIPLHSRRVTDRRLYGERGRFITYGALIHEGMTDQIDTLASMYGTHVVTWDRDALTYSTACINDSQMSPYVVPTNSRNIKKMIFALMAPRILNLSSEQTLTHIVSQAMFGIFTFPNFIEVQMHDQMTVSRIVDVIDLR